jgi:hypothetical protein
VGRAPWPARDALVPLFFPRIESPRARRAGRGATDKALYVLHAFMKKSKSGIGLPRPDAELIAVRLRRARELDAEDRT